MTKRHAEIREALVTGIRNNPEKSPALKHAAERWIGVIDEIEKAGETADTTRVFNERRIDFMRIAEAAPPPLEQTLAEIRAAFGLVERHQ